MWVRMSKASEGDWWGPGKVVCVPSWESLECHGTVPANTFGHSPFLL